MPTLVRPTTLTPDFTQRLDPALLPELMDEPCTYEDFRACVRDIAATTRLTGADRPILRFLAQATASQPQTAALHIVDVGSGGGDILRSIALWAIRQHLPVQLTGIDLNPHATRAATEFSADNPHFNAIQWVTGDVFAHTAVQHPDLVLSSLVTHHMRDDEIIHFLRWMEAHARRGWFISDLVRSPRAYALFGPLSRLMRWHRFVQNDGLVSIRRAFRQQDWERLLAAAEIPRHAVRFHFGGFGRLCLTRLR